MGFLATYSQPVCSFPERDQWLECFELPRKVSKSKKRRGKFASPLIAMDWASLLAAPAMHACSAVEAAAALDAGSAMEAAAD
jgi:hypothetical protein